MRQYCKDPNDVESVFQSPNATESIVVPKRIQRSLRFVKSRYLQHRRKENAFFGVCSNTTQVDNGSEGSTLARMEDYPGAPKDWTTPGYQTSHTHPALMQSRAYRSLYKRRHEIALCQRPCRQLPGATIGTNKRICGSNHASHRQRVRCGLMLPLAVVSSPVEVTSMADARRTESGSGRSLHPVVQLHLQLIRIWALSFPCQTATVPLALGRKTGVRLLDHSA